MTFSHLGIVHLYTRLKLGERTLIEQLQFPNTWWFAGQCLFISSYKCFKVRPYIWRKFVKLQKQLPRTLGSIISYLKKFCFYTKSKSSSLRRKLSWCLAAFADVWQLHWNAACKGLSWWNECWLILLTYSFNVKLKLL